MFYYNISKDDLKELAKRSANLAKALCAFWLPLSDIRNEALNKAKEYTYAYYDGNAYPHFKDCDFSPEDKAYILSQIEKAIDKYQSKF
jgi:hypothetical protein